MADLIVHELHAAFEGVQRAWREDFFQCEEGLFGYAIGVALRAMYVVSIGESQGLGYPVCSRSADA